MNELFHFCSGWATSGLQFGDGATLLKSGALEELVEWLLGHGMSSETVLKVWRPRAELECGRGGEAEHERAHRKIGCALAHVVKNMFDFVRLLNAWLHMREPSQEKSEQLLLQRDKHLSCLEVLGSNLPPSVHFVVHHLPHYAAILGGSLYMFLEESFEAAHTTDHTLSRLTNHDRQCPRDTYNTWECILRNHAAMATL